MSLWTGTGSQDETHCTPEWRPRGAIGLTYTGGEPTTRTGATIENFK